MRVKFTYPKIETSAVNINATRGNAQVLFDEMFDEVLVMKALWYSYIDIWLTNSLHVKENVFNCYNHSNHQSICMPNICHVVEYSSCLIGTCASVERVDSNRQCMVTGKG
jgi:hypothetical protein